MAIGRCTKGKTVPTFWSKTLIPTSRQVPGDAEVPSHQLMLRAGFIRKLAAGIYDYLPLGLRSLHKVMAVVRQEMDRTGACEVLLPALQPIELWQQTGRHIDYGENLFVVKDRHDREHALGPTHEEVITSLAGTYIKSYKQLPINLYQIQTKFRDEFRPRFGVLRSREFQMKDGYSFDSTREGLDRSYQVMYDAYCRIFNRCGLQYVVVDAESGEMGGSGSQQFTVLTPTGEDTIFRSDKGNYAANLEKCPTGDRSHDFTGDPTGDLEEIYTPDCPGIDDVRDFFSKSLGSRLKTSNMLKSMVYVASKISDHRDPHHVQDLHYILVVLRGDHDVNEEKLSVEVTKILGEKVSVMLAPEKLAMDDGWALGFVGPHAFVGRTDTTLLVDPDAAQGGFWVAGANKVHHHVKHFNWDRDVADIVSGNKNIVVADLRNAIDGDPSPKNDDGVLKASHGIEVGQVFKLGTKYTESLDATVLDEENNRVPIIMGCYGIGINRIMASVIEQTGGHDENGIIWPASIAPYQILITPIKYEGVIKQTADRLADELETTGCDVLLDDRDERPGVKFKDADLIGIPLRITIGDKALKEGCVEIKPRRASVDTKSQLVPVGDVVKYTVDLLSRL